MNMNEHETRAHKTTEANWTWFLFSLRGRINRKPFWVFNIIIFAGVVLLSMFTGVSHDINEMSKPQMMFMIWIFWPSIAVQAKRWHDVDKSALWVFINFIPFIGPLWALFQNGFIPGTPGPNRFGPDPLEENK